MHRGSTLLLTFVTALTFASGCSDDEFSDEAFGVMDLSPLFDAGGLPLQMDPQAGFIDDATAEFYDFGVVPVRTDVTTGLPNGARVNPMYFFFDEAGHPLASRPVREERTGADFMPGGKNALNPNPHDFCNGRPVAEDKCNEPGDDYVRALAEKKKSYPARTRDPLIDPDRQVADYQRPIIDIFPGDVTSSRPFYTGIWEIVEVTVPGNYKADDIKSWTTLKKALASKKFKAYRTEKAINCPIVDERTNVVTGVSNRTIFHPRIELWYRRKLSYCYLVNGWEALGNRDGELYQPGNDAQRLDTFDVDRIRVGEEGTDTFTTALSVPIRFAYVPTHTVPNQDPTKASTRVRMVKNYLSDGLPRTTEADPPGYTPIRWMWDFSVPSDYKVGTVRSIKAAQDFPRSPRDGRVITRNFATRGLNTPCSINVHPGTLFCEEFPDPIAQVITVAQGDNVDGATGTFTLTNGGFDPSTDFGKVTRYLTIKGAANRANNGVLKVTAALSATTVVALNTIPNALPFVSETFDPAKVTAVYGDPPKEGKAIVDTLCSSLNLECNKETCVCDAPAVGYGKVCGPGIARCKEEEDDFSKYGYTCFPAPAAGNKGFCYVGCDSTAPNTTKQEDGAPYRDSRCKNLANYRCLGFSRTPAQHRFCLRTDCDASDTDPMSTQCTAMAKPLDDEGSLKSEEVDIAAGQICQDWGLTLCAWPEDYEPK